MYGCELVSIALDVSGWLIECIVFPAAPVPGRKRLKRTRDLAGECACQQSPWDMAKQR